MASGRRGLGQRSKSIVIDLGEDIRRKTSLDALSVAGVDHNAPLDGSTQTEVLSAIEAAEPEAAKERALRLLGYRERSTHELRNRLSDDGYPADVVHMTIARLTELSLLDDARFAELFVRTKIASGWGRRRIARALEEHALVEGLMLEVLETHCPDIDEATRAADQLRGRSLVSAKDRDWAIRRLVRRGFSYGAAKDGVSLAAEVGPKLDRGTRY